jgi:transposase
VDEPACRLVAQRAGYKASLKDQRAILGTVSDPLLFTVQGKMIECLSIQISVLEKKIDGMIVRDPDLNRMLKLLTSIRGIGKVTARFLIVTTYGFTAFETWRKYASYCGIAPFPNQSGTSVRGKTKVSNLANKDGKTLLTMCAMSAIQCDPEIRSYYNQRIESGKSKMSTINIIRNKLLSRAFAVIKRGSPYVDTMRYAA